MTRIRKIDVRPAIARKWLQVIFVSILTCYVAATNEAVAQLPPLPERTESPLLDSDVAQSPDEGFAETGVGPSPTEGLNFGDGAAEYGESQQSTYLSRETPLFARLRQAISMEQPTLGRLNTGSGRFGFGGETAYDAEAEGPGFVDVLFPQTARSLRERFTKAEESEPDDEEILPPTFLSRLNGLFFNHLLADSTLPFSIRNPAPDQINFPNSAYTIERGHMYIETEPLQIVGPTNMNAYTYMFDYLIRFGLTDRVEFRLFSNGLTYEAAYKGNPYTGVGPSPAVTGASPIFIDFKINFWEQRLRSLMPAMGMEVFMSTETGSQSFRTGVSYGINLLFDLNFGDGWNLEWNLGIQPDNINDPRMPDAVTPQFNFQWSVQKALTDNLAAYVHGYLNGAALPNYGGDDVIGAGLAYFIGKRWSVWGSYNVGLDAGAGPPFLYKMGIAYAY